MIDKDISEKYKIKNIIEEECRLDWLLSGKINRYAI